MSLLQVKQLSISFGGIQALRRADLEVEEGEILGLIGPNGSGKTTLLNCISRFYEPDEGEIYFRGENLLKWGVHDIAGRGIARTFQGVEAFRSLNTLGNVLVGLHCRMKRGMWAEVLGIGYQQEKKAIDKAESLLKLTGLEPVKDKMVGGLPFGQLKLVELARAVASDPKLLLLDEPTAGMSTEETQNLATTLLTFREKLGVSIIVVGHDMRLVMGISDRIIVLNFGVKIGEGHPSEIRQNPEVVKSYLGDWQLEPDR